MSASPRPRLACRWVMVTAADLAEIERLMVRGTWLKGVAGLTSGLAIGLAAHGHLLAGALLGGLALVAGWGAWRQRRALRALLTTCRRPSPMPVEPILERWKGQS